MLVITLGPGNVDLSVPATITLSGTVALKMGLVERGVLPNAVVRPPLLPLAEGAREEISAALTSAGLIGDNAHYTTTRGFQATSVV